MSKKHYEAIASTLNVMLHHEHSEARKWLMKNDAANELLAVHRAGALYGAANALADEFALDNRKFDRRRFMDAVVNGTEAERVEKL